MALKVNVSYIDPITGLPYDWVEMPMFSIPDGYVNVPKHVMDSIAREIYGSISALVTNLPAVRHIELEDVVWTSVVPRVLGYHHAVLIRPITETERKIELFMNAQQHTTKFHSSFLNMIALKPNGVIAYDEARYNFERL